MLNFLSFFKSSSNTKTSHEEEMEKFSSYSSSWWDLKGPMIMLYTYNQIRIPFICDALSKSTNKDDTNNTKEPLKGYTVLDAGCGGGMVTEIIARLGAKVTGVDPNNDLINTAKSHLAEDKSINNRVDYICGKIEDYGPKNKDKFDVIISTDVLEHIDNPETHLNNCVVTLKPGGSIFISTWSKSYLNWMIGIKIFENIFGLPPKGSHEYEKFISPEDVADILEKNNCKTVNVKGTLFNPFTKKWSIIPTTKFCYILHAIKNKSENIQD